MIKKEDLKRTFFYVFYRRLKNYDKGKRDVFVDTFYGANYSPAEIRSIKRSLKWAFLIWGVKYKEFWKWKFEEKGLREKRQYVPRSAELNLYYQVNPREQYVRLLEDKMA